MTIAKNSKRKNRLEQLLYLNKEIKHLKANGKTGSLQLVEREKKILEEYIRNIKDTELRELLEDAYFSNRVRVFADESCSKKKNRYLNKHPLKNIYDSEKVYKAKKILKELVNQKRNRNGYKQMNNNQIENYISALDDSRYRMILRYYLICDKPDREIRKKVGYSENSSIFPPLEKYFCNLS